MIPLWLLIGGGVQVTWILVELTNEALIVSGGALGAMCVCKCISVFHIMC